MAGQTTAGLPPGWEWDYDGSRWLYRYKSTGHVQYHFPSAGDEFPDYVDFFAPAPDLAPEELLESQQQVKRHAVKNGRVYSWSEELRKKKMKQQQQLLLQQQLGTKKRGSAMSAVAQPVSFVLSDAPGSESEGQDEVEAKGIGNGGDEGGRFQPESLMFLGPGVSAGASQLIAEKEEQEAKEKGLSPKVVSETTTSLSTNSGPAKHCPMTSTPGKDESGPLNSTGGPDVGGRQEQEVENDSTATRGIDPGHHAQPIGSETQESEPVRQPFDPVGVIAEMATEDTAPAVVEASPDPFELADTSILAPVETEVSRDAVELATEDHEIGAAQRRREEARHETQRQRQRRLRMQEEELQKLLMSVEARSVEAMGKDGVESPAKPDRTSTDSGSSLGLSQTSEPLGPLRISSPQQALLAISPALISPLMQIAPPKPPKTREETYPMPISQSASAPGPPVPPKIPEDPMPGQRQAQASSHGLPPIQGERHQLMQTVGNILRHPSILRPGARATPRPQGDSPDRTHGSVPHPEDHQKRSSQPLVSGNPVSALPYPLVFPGELRPLPQRQSAVPAFAMHPPHESHHQRPAYPDPSWQSHQRRQTYAHPPSMLMEHPGSRPEAMYSGLLFANFASRPPGRPQLISIPRRPLAKRSLAPASRSRAESAPPRSPLISPVPVKPPKEPIDLPPATESRLPPFPGSQPDGSAEGCQTPAPTISPLLPSEMLSPPDADERAIIPPMETVSDSNTAPNQSESLRSHQPVGPHTLGSQSMHLPAVVHPAPGNSLISIEEHHEDFEANTGSTSIALKRHTAPIGFAGQPPRSINDHPMQQPQLLPVHFTQATPGPQMAPAQLYGMQSQMIPRQPAMGRPGSLALEGAQRMPSWHLAPSLHPPPTQRGLQPLIPPIQTPNLMKGPVNAGTSKPLRPRSVPPMQTPLSPTSKEKSSGWTRWFKSYRSSAQNPAAAPATQQTYPYVNIPPPHVRTVSYDPQISHSAAPSYPSSRPWQPGTTPSSVTSPVPTPSPSILDKALPDLPQDVDEEMPLRQQRAGSGSVSPVSGRSCLQPLPHEQRDEREAHGQSVKYWPGYL